MLKAVHKLKATNLLIMKLTTKDEKQSSTSSEMGMTISEGQETKLYNRNITYRSSNMAGVMQYDRVQTIYCVK